MILLFNEDSQAEKKVEHVLHSPTSPSVIIAIIYSYFFSE